MIRTNQSAGSHLRWKINFFACSSELKVPDEQNKFKFMAHRSEGNRWSLLYMCIMQYSTTPQIRTHAVLPNNSVLIRKASFGEREACIYSTNCYQEFVSFLEGCPLWRVSFKRLVCHHCILIIVTVWHWLAKMLCKTYICTWNLPYVKLQKWNFQLRRLFQLYIRLH